MKLISDVFEETAKKYNSRTTLSAPGLSDLLKYRQAWELNRVREEKAAGGVGGRSGHLESLECYEREKNNSIL